MRRDAGLCRRLTRILGRHRREQLFLQERDLAADGATRAQRVDRTIGRHRERVRRPVVAIDAVHADGARPPAWPRRRRRQMHCESPGPSCRSRARLRDRLSCVASDAVYSTTIVPGERASEWRPGASSSSSADSVLVSSSAISVSVCVHEVAARTTWGVAVDAGVGVPECGLSGSGIGRRTCPKHKLVELSRAVELGRDQLSRLARRDSSHTRRARRRHGVRDELGVSLACGRRPRRTGWIPCSAPRPRLRWRRCPG